MLEKLRELYEVKLAPDLKVLEQKRLSLLGVCISLSILSAAILLLGIAIQIMPVLIAGAAGLVVVFIVLHIRLRNFNRDYKNLVMNRLLEHWGPDFKYDPKDGIPKKEFNASRLFSIQPNVYKTEDLVRGRVGATDIRFAEFRASHQTSNGKSTTVVKVFSGIYFEADFHKEFSSSTWVLPDHAERMLGPFLGKLIQRASFSRPGRLTTMENSEFENMFVVYTTDEVECRYILSPSLMERMVDLGLRQEQALSFAFIDSRMIIALSSNENAFEPPHGGFGNYLNFDKVLAHYMRLKQLMQIVDDLNMNTRIWTKR